MRFDLNYRIEGKRKGERTSLKVKGKTSFRFKFIQSGAIGPTPPP